MKNAAWLIATVGLLVSTTPATAKELAPALREFLIANSPPANASMEKEWPTRVAIAEIRRDDGGHDIAVYISGRSWCGSGGCELMILEPDGTSFRILGDLAITNLPIRQLKTSSHGHPDIGVVVRGGGIRPGYEACLHFDGKTYPNNPTVPPAEPIKGNAEGRVIIAQAADNAPDEARGDLLYR